MSSQNLKFKCAVITGGAGGLGKAMAEYYISLGKKVIIVGRTESKLQSTAKELGNIPYYVLDTGKVADIPAVAKQIIQEHPEVDCLVNNAGVQKPLNIHKYDLASADQEIDINIRGPTHLTIAFLDHLKSKADGGVVMNVSSSLGFCPVSLLNPNYNGTKAWVHFWSTTVRSLLADSKVRVVEIVPPAVGTDLHRDREDPDDNKKHKNSVALTIEEFMDDFKAGMEKGLDTVGAGLAKGMIEKWDNAYQEPYSKAATEYLKKQ